MAGYKTWGASDVPSSSDVNTFLMQQAVPRFPTVAARNAAITSPAAGQMCATDDFDEVYIRNAANTAWVGVVPRVVYKPNTTTRTSTSLVNDPDLHMALEPSSRYIMDWHIQNAGDTGSDFRCQWAYTGTMAEAKVGAVFKPVGATSNNNSLTALDTFNTPLATVMSTGIITGDIGGFWGGGYWKTTTGGTLTFQWGLNSGSASTDVSLGSYISLLKVA